MAFNGSTIESNNQWKQWKSISLIFVYLDCFQLTLLYFNRHAIIGKKSAYKSSVKTSTLRHTRADLHLNLHISSYSRYKIEMDVSSRCTTPRQALLFSLNLLYIPDWSRYLYRHTHARAYSIHTYIHLYRGVAGSAARESKIAITRGAVIERDARDLIIGDALAPRNKCIRGKNSFSLSRLYTPYSSS